MDDLEKMDNEEEKTDKKKDDPRYSEMSSGYQELEDKNSSLMRDKTILRD